MEKSSSQQQNEQNEQLQQNFLKARLHIQQLNRTVWQLVQMLGGKAEVNPELIPMLWDLRVQRGEKPGNIILNALEIPHIQEEDLNRLAQALRGTTKDLMEVKKELNLNQYPAPYLQVKLAPHLIQAESGVWMAPRHMTAW